MNTKVKVIASDKKTNILEQGNIYFFYRPHVQSEEKKAEAIPQGIKDIQKFYFILHPEKVKKYRLISIGKKKLPTIINEHTKN